MAKSKDKKSKDKKLLSRRDFFVASGAITAAGALGAVTPKTIAKTLTKTTTATNSKLWLPEKWDYEADVVVVGYGGAGTVAAITAHDAGAKVLILEKAPYRGGGNTSVSLGEWVSPTSVQDAVSYLTAACRGQTPPDVIKAWAKEVCKNKAFYNSMGVAYGEPQSRPGYPNLPGASSMRYFRTKGIGAGWFAIMDKHRQDRGIDVVFGARGKELIQDGSTKEILGVRADMCSGGYGQEKMEKEITVKAKRAVVMTTGGFEFNEEMKAMFHKAYPTGYYGWRYNEGDGIKMCQKVGADLWHMDVMAGAAQGCLTDVDPSINFQMKIRPKAIHNLIHVDSFGRRFMNEAEPIHPHSGYLRYLHWDEAECQFVSTPHFVIFDNVNIKAGPLGEVMGAPYTRGLLAIGKDLGGWGGWSEDNQAEIDKGWIRKGDNAEELASALQKGRFGVNINAEYLKTSIDRYNEFCEKGVDEDFGRDPKTLFPLNPPYYAFGRTIGGICTHGGPRRGANAAVLDPNMKPIPRLFSAGSFGSVYARTYSVTGGNLGELSAFGRIAGRSAAAVEPWC
jgi:succinate dehydrogenase/fumarate reductase flavoprotein subunit